MTDPQATRVLLVDDHQMLRDGLRMLLEREADVTVVGEASGGRQAISMARDLEPDIVVMDIAMAGMNGIEATRQIMGILPRCRVIALSTYSDRRYVLNMLEAGAAGYVVKLAAGEELLRAVQVVRLGKKYLSPEITDVVVSSYVDKQNEAAASAYAALGPREREVLQLVAEGITSAGIAERMHISPKTVEAHRRNIMKKLNLHSVAALTKYAIREGLTAL